MSGRGSFVIALVGCLLAFATSAFAECAWVMWHHMTTTNPAAPPEGIWEPLEAFRGPGECKPFADKMTAKRISEKVRRDTLGNEYLSTYVCLPDTVDPRGPKGK